MSWISVDERKASFGRRNSVGVSENRPGCNVDKAGAPLSHLCHCCMVARHGHARARVYPGRHATCSGWVPLLPHRLSSHTTHNQDVHFRVFVVSYALRLTGCDRSQSVVPRPPTPFANGWTTIPLAGPTTRLIRNRALRRLTLVIARLILRMARLAMSTRLQKIVTFLVS